MAADLGPWRGDDLLGTATTFNGVGAGADLPPPLRFARGVGNLVINHLRHAGDGLRRDAISVFVLCPGGVQGMRGNREPTLGDGDVDVAGRIWFVGQTAQNGHCINPPSTASGKIFDYVQAIGCGHYPTVVFNPKTQPAVLRFYSSGIDDEENVEVIEIGNRAVTVQRVEAILDRLWENSFITPDAQISHASAVWEDSEKLRAKTKAEAIVQAHIKTALAVALVDCVIRHEQTTTLGRIDIEVEQRALDDPLQWTRPIEIEVKVLREYGATGKKKSDTFNHRWIKRGIRQAAAYRDVQNAHEGMLCCFDMRAKDHAEDYCPVDARELAAEHDVVIFRRFLYNSAEALRVARYPASGTA